MAFRVKLADIVFEVNGIYENELKKFCKDYVCDENEENNLCKDYVDDRDEYNSGRAYIVNIEEKDINREQGTMKDENPENVFLPEYLETLALLRKVAEELPEKNRFLMHGAVIEYDNKAYMFTAPSGTGKTTHIRLWRKFLGEKVSIINGDKPFIKAEDEIRAYGTPWAGKEGWQNNKSDKLGGICIVQRGKKNEIRRISSKEAIVYLMGQIHFPDSPKNAGKTLEMLDLLLKKVPVYILKCDISKQAFITSYQTMTGEVYMM